MYSYLDETRKTPAEQQFHRIKLLQQVGTTGCQRWLNFRDPIASERVTSPWMKGTGGNGPANASRALHHIDGYAPLSSNQIKFICLGA